MQTDCNSRRSFLKCAGMGAVTAAAAGLLAGCGGSDSSSSSTASSAAAAEPADPNKPYAGVTLYYAATDTEATGPEMQDIVAMVKEKTGINIEFNIIPKADTGEVDKRLVSLQAGDALDIVYGTVAQLKVFYDAGVLEPLDELAGAASYDIKSVFGDSAPVYDDGQTYGLPAFTDVWCTFINTKVFENAGVEIPSAEGWTWEKYIETAQKLTNLDEEIYGSLMLDYDCYNYMYALQNGAEHYKEDGTSNYDDPRFRDSVEFFYSLGNELQIQPDITTYKAGVYPWNAFPSTGVANADGSYDKAQFGMFVCGGWAASMLPDTEKYPRDWQCVILPMPYPEGQEPSTLTVPGCYAVPSTSKNKEAAFEAVRCIAENQYTLIYVPVIMILSFILAYLLNKGVFWAKGIRSMFFLPYVSNMVAVAVVFQLMLGPRGPFYLLQKFFGVEDPIIPLLNQKWALPVVVLIAVWKGIGLNFLTYLGALQNVDKSQVEAAEIDGANKWQQIKNVVIPAVAPTTFFLTISSIITSLQNFTVIQSLTDGGPGQATTVMSLNIVNTAFVKYETSYAAAQALVMFAIVMVITLIQWRGQKKWADQ